MLTLSTSTYIFYSRTFLIESLALLLTLAFVLGAVRILYRETCPSWRDSWVIAVGVLAALVKVTTFSMGFGLVILFIGLKLLEASGFWKDRQWQFKLGFLATALLLSVLAAYAWNQFILASWARSPQYADAHLGIQRWNFGELMQRNRPEFWGRMFSHVLEKPFGSILLGLVGLAGFAFATRTHRLLAFAFLTAWFGGFLIWANLYYAHDYYVYATAVYFIIWAVISLQSTAAVYPLLRWPNFWTSERYRQTLDTMAEQGRMFGGIVVRNEPQYLQDMNNFINYHQLEVGPKVISDWGDWVFLSLKTEFPR